MDDLPLENSYKMTASVRVCYEQASCAVNTINLLSDFKVPKTTCEWGSGFLTGSCFF